MNKGNCVFALSRNSKFFYLFIQGRTCLSLHLTPPPPLFFNLKEARVGRFALNKVFDDLRIIIFRVILKPGYGLRLPEGRLQNTKPHISPFASSDSASLG